MLIQSQVDICAFFFFFFFAKAAIINLIAQELLYQQAAGSPGHTCKQPQHPMCQLSARDQEIRRVHVKGSGDKATALWEGVCSSRAVLQMHSEFKFNKRPY